MNPSDLNLLYDDLDDSCAQESGNEELLIEPAPERREHGDAIRLDLIEEVKKRLKSGYYHSERVIEDMSETFAQAINQAV